jgi:D-amino-acid dehydrogenase
MFNTPSSSHSSSEVLIIGGGIIGVCTGYYLARAGYDVTLVEKDQVNAGSTAGNAGLIIPSDSLPVPGPGVLTQGLRWLLDSASPFYIKPTLDPAVLRWLWEFQGACRESAWQQAAPVLTELSVQSVRLFEQLLQEENIACQYHRNGLLLLYRSEAGFLEGQELVEKLASLGVHGRALPAGELDEFFPPSRSELSGGLYFEPDAHLDPAEFTEQLAARAVEHGMRLVEDCEVLDFEVGSGKIHAVLTTRGKFQAEEFILAAGAWSANLADQLDLRLPIQPAKGYSLTFQRPEHFPEIPLILDEVKIAVTPLGDSLRLAGTLELAGLDLEINQRRIEAIYKNAGRYLEVDLTQQPVVEIWRGLRPCTPDGLPVIGRTRAAPNLITASGHCMLGISQGPMTARLVAELVQGRQPSLDLSLLDPDRF